MIGTSRTWNVKDILERLAMWQNLIFIVGYRVDR